MISTLGQRSFMEPFDPYRYHSDIQLLSGQQTHNAYARPREERPQVISRHKQLPSFSEILPDHVHTEIDAVPAQSFLNTVTPEPASALSQSTSLGFRPAVTPTENPSLSSSMPDNFDDYQRGHDPMYAVQSHQRHNSSWSSSPQYPEMMSPFGAQQRTPFQNQHLPMSRLSPSLPPIRDIDPRLERVNGHDSGYMPTNGQYQQVYNQPQANSGMHDSNQLPMRRPPYYDNNQRYSQPYPASNRSYPQASPDFPRYGQPSVDPYRNPSAYSGHYSGMDYASQPLSVGQSSNYGVAMDSADSRNRRRRGNLPKPVTDILRAWFHEHLDHPYPSEEDKQLFIQRTGLTMNQISNWFINARRRHLPALRHARNHATPGGPTDQEADSQARSR